MRDRVHLIFVALFALAVGLAHLREPGFGDDLTYWTQALEVHERGTLGWDRGSFHDLRWPVWGVCWAIQGVMGFGISSYYGVPLLYLALGAMFAFALGRRMLGTAEAGWAGSMAFLFHPLLDSVCFRPMPDLSEGVLGAAVILTWWGMVHASETRARTLWALLLGLLVYVVESNRVTGAFVVPILIVITIAFHARKFGWLVGAGVISAALYAGEAVFYHQLFGDWLHNIHANMNNAGNKGTTPMPLWMFPVRFADAFWSGGPLVRVYTLAALVGIPYAWGKLGQAGRVVVIWFVMLYLEYSCTPQPIWPIRPLIRDADRFLAGLTVPMSLLAVAGFWAAFRALQSRIRFAAPASVLGCAAVLTLGLATKRERFNLGFVPEFASYLRALPPGTKVFTHEAMRAMAKLCDDQATRRLTIEAPSSILLKAPELEKMASNADEFWYARKLVWLGTRKALERGALPKQPPLGSYFDEPEREWTLTRMLAKGDTPDLIFYRRRQAHDPAPFVLGPESAELQELVPALPRDWLVGRDPKQTHVRWTVPALVRGKYVRLEARAGSAQPESFTLRLKFRTNEKEPVEYLLKPYLHREVGKEFFVFAIPDVDVCDVTLRFTSRAKAVSFEAMRLVVERPH